MFGRTGNAKPSVAQASAWVTYLLLAIGIVSPVVCVIWLVQRTVENENLLFRELVKEARQRSVADAESLIRLTALSLVPNEGNGGLRFSLRTVPSMVAKEESDAARAKLSGIRVEIEELSVDESLSLLAGYIEDEDVSAMKLTGGRMLGPMLIEMGLRRAVGAEDMGEPFRKAATRYIESRSALISNDSQFRFLVKRYALFSDSPKIQGMYERLGLLDKWIAEGDPLLAFQSGSGYFALLNDAGSEVSIFPYEAILYASRGLESLRNNQFEVALRSESIAEGAYTLSEPLGFLVLKDLASLEGQNRVSSEKAVMYIWIGGIVLGLSVLSGVAIVASVRRQQSVTRLKDNLVATVTHELKTPVASIRLLVDTLLDEKRKGKVDTQEYVELISRENQRLGRLIDNFLSFSRMERSKGSFDIVPVPPSEVVRSAESAFRERFQGQRFSLDVELEPDLPEILGDKDALSTVLGNLLENAFKYGGRDREIILRARNTGNGVAFEVEDFGSGIPKREQKRIFRKFYQMDGGHRGTGGSVGLGLSIVDFIVSKHSGLVELDSEEGVGSLFRVRIPYA